MFPSSFVCNIVFTFQKFREKQKSVVKSKQAKKIASKPSSPDENKEDLSKQPPKLDQKKANLPESTSEKNTDETADDDDEKQCPKESSNILLDKPLSCNKECEISNGMEEEGCINTSCPNPPEVTATEENDNNMHKQLKPNYQSSPHVIPIISNDTKQIKCIDLIDSSSDENSVEEISSEGEESDDDIFQRTLIGEKSMLDHIKQLQMQLTSIKKERRIQVKFMVRLKLRCSFTASVS